MKGLERKGLGRKGLGRKGFCVPLLWCTAEFKVPAITFGFDCTEPWSDTVTDKIFISAPAAA